MKHALLSATLAMSLTSAASAAPALPPEAESLARAADSDGLPGERLRTKAQEGVAKGVPAERLLQVLRGMRQQMDEGAALLTSVGPAGLAPAQRRQLVAGMVTARQAGVPAEELSSLAQVALGELRDPASFEAATGALTDLVVQGYDGRGCGELVRLALAKGFRGTELAGLVHAVRELRKQVEPGAALQAVSEAVRARRRVGPSDAPGQGPQGGKVDVNTPAAEHSRGQGRGRGPRDKP